MKARRRVVTSGAAPAKRRPTVRRIKPAILPATRRVLPPPPAAPTRTGGGASQRAHPAPSLERDGARSGIAQPVDLSVDLGRGLRLANPILVASGTFGYGVEYGDVIDVDVGPAGRIRTRLGV